MVRPVVLPSAVRQNKLLLNHNPRSAAVALSPATHNRFSCGSPKPSLLTPLSAAVALISPSLLPLSAVARVSARRLLASVLPLALTEEAPAPAADESATRCSPIGIPPTSPSTVTSRPRRLPKGDTLEILTRNQSSSLAKILLYPRHWWRRLPSNSVAVRHARRPPQRTPVGAVLDRQNAGRDAARRPSRWRLWQEWRRRRPLRHRVHAHPRGRRPREPSIYNRVERHVRHERVHVVVLVAIRLLRAPGLARRQFGNDRRAAQPS